MSTYQALKGINVKSLASDPANTKYGQIWYNNTAKQIKFIGNNSGAWSSGGNLPDVRMNCHMSGGTQTAGLYAGGGNGSNAYQDDTFEYNGTSWSEVNDFPKNQSDFAGGGTQTASFSSGGNIPNDTRQVESFDYDGTNWTAGGNLSTASGQGAACGTATAGMHCGGTSGGGTIIDETFEYDGSSWTTSGDLPENQAYHYAVGSQTASLSCFHLINGTAQSTASYEYNGTAWSAGGQMSTRRTAGGLFGIQTLAVGAGGGGGNDAGASKESVESYNGTAWAEETPTLNQAAYRHANGTNAAGLLTGGNDSPVGSGPNATMNRTEEWNTPPLTGGVVKMDVS